MLSESEIKAITPKISNGLNSLSVACSILVLVLFSIIALYRPQLVNRTTLRLQVGISFFDFLNHLFALFHHQVKSGPFCIFLAFWRNFGGQMYCFLNIAIAINLQLIFIHNLTPKPRWEWFYWGISILIAGILSFIPLGMNYYGQSSNSLCYIIDDAPGAKELIFVNTSLIFLITFVYLAIIAIIVNIKLVRAKGGIDALVHNRDSSEVNKEYQKNLKKLIFRITLIPIVCLLGLLGFIVGYIILTTENRRIPEVSLWGTIGITTKGFFNMVTIFLDPSFQNAAYSTYLGLFKGQTIDKKEEDKGVELNNVFSIGEDGSKTYDAESQISKIEGEVDVENLTGYQKFL